MDRHTLEEQRMVLGHSRLWLRCFVGLGDKWRRSSDCSLTFHQQAPDDLGVAVAVPHLTHVGAGVGGPRALDHQARHALPEAGVRFQGAVVFQPAVLGGWVPWCLAGKLHPVGSHDLTPVKAIQDHRLGVCRVLGLRIRRWKGTDTLYIWSTVEQGGCHGADQSWPSLQLSTNGFLSHGSHLRQRGGHCCFAWFRRCSDAVWCSGSYTIRPHSVHPEYTRLPWM